MSLPIDPLSEAEQRAFRRLAAALLPSAQPWKGCSDCCWPRFCAVHQCAGTSVTKRTRCGNPVMRGWVNFCSSHGCAHELEPGVMCESPRQSATDMPWCAEHEHLHPKPVPYRDTIQPRRPLDA